MLRHLRLVAEAALAFKTGGASAAVGPVLRGLLGLLSQQGGGGDDEEAAWEREMVHRWAKKYEELLGKPMSGESKKRTVEAMLERHYVLRWARQPKESWIEEMHGLLISAAKGRFTEEI